MSKIKVFVEASAITEERLSGVGHNTLETIRLLDKNIAFKSIYQLVLVTHFEAANMLARWNFSDDVKIRKIMLPRRIFHGLLLRRLIPPMDLFFGKGIYLFPNYKNWPLAFSKSITYIYDVAFAVFPETVQPKNLRMLQKNIAFWAHRTNKIITISKSSKKEIEENLSIKSSKIDVIYCGVNTTVYKKQPTETIDAAKKKYGIQGGYLLFVGNIEPRKNLSNLLDAYSSLPRDLLKKYSLVIVGGGGWLNEDIIKKMNNLQKQGLKIVHPSIYVLDEDLPAIYSGAKLLIHPAIHEGFGITPIEAMACETPVAVSDISVMREVVGDVGLYFNPLDIGSITDTMTRALTDKKVTTRLVTTSRPRALEFSWKKSTEKIITIFNNQTKVTNNVTNR